MLSGSDLKNPRSGISPHICINYIVCMNTPLVRIGTKFKISGHLVEVTEITKDGIIADLHETAKRVRKITLDLDKVTEAVIKGEK